MLRTSGVSESSGVHGRAAGYRGATTGVSESSGCHGRESRRALGETGVSGSRVANSTDSETADDDVDDGDAPSRRRTRADPSSSPLSAGIPAGGSVANALRNVFRTPRRASGSQEQKQESSEVPSAPPLASLADGSAVFNDEAGAFADRPSADPLHGVHDSVRFHAFSILVHSVSLPLRFLVQNVPFGDLLGAWSAIQSHFRVNTRATRSLRKRNFMNMLMERNEKFGQFCSRIEREANVLNMMSDDPIVSDEDCLAVLLEGVRVHHLNVFAVTLRMIELQEDGVVTYMSAKRQMMSDARCFELGSRFGLEDTRSESANFVERQDGGGRCKEQRGSARERPAEVAPKRRKGKCYRFLKGSCRFGNACRFRHEKAEAPEKSKNAGKCMFCGKVGHYAADCHKWKGQGKTVRFAQSALAAADKSGSDGDEFVFAAFSSPVGGGMGVVVPSIVRLLVIAVLVIASFVDVLFADEMFSISGLRFMLLFFFFLFNSSLGRSSGKRTTRCSGCRSNKTRGKRFFKRQLKNEG